MTREVAERCARSSKGKDMMRLPARPIMGTQRNYWEWLARRAAWLAVQTALEEYDGQMPKMDELGGYCWVDSKGEEQRVEPAVLRPLFELVAQQETFSDNDDYDFPVNALSLRDKEWETFLQNSLDAVPLFRLKNSKRVAKSHLVNHWSAIPDGEVELEDAVREEMDTEDEEASNRMVEGNGFRRSYPDDGIEQHERHVRQRLDDSSPAPDLSSEESGTGSGLDSHRTPRTRAGSGNRFGPGLDSADSGTVAENKSPMSRKLVFTSFVAGLTEENLDAQLRRMASAKLQEDVSLSTIVKEMSHLPRSLASSYTDSALFETFSSSSRLLHSASLALHEVRGAFLSYCLWVTFARIWDFWKAGQQLAIHNIQQDPVDEFTTLNSSP